MAALLQRFNRLVAQKDERAPSWRTAAPRLLYAHRASPTSCSLLRPILNNVLLFPAGYTTKKIKMIPKDSTASASRDG